MAATNGNAVVRLGGRRGEDVVYGTWQDLGMADMVWVECAAPVVASPSSPLSPRVQAARAAAFGVAWSALVDVVGESDVAVGLWVVEHLVCRTRYIRIRGTNYGDVAEVVLTGRVLDRLAVVLPGWQVDVVV